MDLMRTSVLVGLNQLPAPDSLPLVMITIFPCDETTVSEENKYVCKPKCLTTPLTSAKNTRNQALDRLIYLLLASRYVVMVTGHNETQSDNEDALLCAVTPAAARGTHSLSALE